MKSFFKKKLKSGVTILFEKRNLPVVSVSASVKYGSAFERESEKGISHFIEHLMFKGSKTRNAEEMAREIEKRGGILNGYTSEEITSYWNKLPSKHIGIGLEIASDLILNPAFDAVEFEKEKQVVIEEIKMYHDTPRYYVPEKIKEMLYEKPFGLSVAGSEGIIRNLKRDFVVNYFNDKYSTDNMILTVVGDADFEEICEMAEKIYPAKKRKLISYNPKEIYNEIIEKRKGIDQASFAFGFHVPNFKNNEKYNYDVAEAYLAGGMSSRLFQEIREKRGLAYAVKGEEDIGENYGFFYVYIGTVKEKIKEIKEIIIKEIGKLKDINSRDFEEAKEQVIGLNELVREDSSSVMNMLMIEEASGNAEDYYKYEERISNVKAEDVKKIKLKGYSTFSLVPE